MLYQFLQCLLLNFLDQDFDLFHFLQPQKHHLLHQMSLYNHLCVVQILHYYLEVDLQEGYYLFLLSLLM
tara:strand:- start:45 stop:251 length:207 start_codon:yes stop_codon:yes gene_type:complete